MFFIDRLVRRFFLALLVFVVIVRGVDTVGLEILDVVFFERLYFFWGFWVFLFFIFCRVEGFLVLELDGRVDILVRFFRYGFWGFNKGFLCVADV